MIRVVLPYHLRTLAQVGAEVALDVTAPVTTRTVLDALEARYPMLKGTIRDHVTKERRPLLRFFVCEEDVSHESPGRSVARRGSVGRGGLLGDWRDRRRLGRLCCSGRFLRDVEALAPR